MLENFLSNRKAYKILKKFDQIGGSIVGSVEGTILMPFVGTFHIGYIFHKECKCEMFDMLGLIFISPLLYPLSAIEGGIIGYKFGLKKSFLGTPKRLFLFWSSENFDWIKYKNYEEL